MSGFFGIEIGKRSIIMSQAALNITGHNTANASTPGYSLQVPDIVTTNPYHAPVLINGNRLGQFGTGVDIAKIQRMRDSFLDSQIRDENKVAGYWKQMEDTLAKLEVVVNEPSDNGLRSVMDKFWQSWQDLSKNAESQSDRGVVAQRGAALAETFRHTYKQLVDLRDDVNASIKIKVSEVNTIALNIADLNKQILAISISGKQPNDLLDKRDLLIDQLSQLADVKVYDQANNMIEVQLGNRMLVRGVDTNSLDTVSDDNGMYMVVWKDTQVAAQFKSGELRGLLDARGKTDLIDESEPSPYKEIIPNMIRDLNTLAKTLIVKINEVHRGGYSLNNRGANPDGTDFFVMPGTDPDEFENWAEIMTVNPTILNDVKNIAAAQHRTWEKDANGEDKRINFGDGKNALSISELKHDLNVQQYKVKTEGLKIVFDPADPLSHDPLVFNIDAGSGVQTITLDPPANFKDMREIVEKLQAELDKKEMPVKVKCEGTGSGNSTELVFYSTSRTSLEVILNNTGINDLAATKLQNGEYCITANSAAAASTSVIRPVQQYLRLGASGIFDRAQFQVNGTTPADVNASIQLEVAAVDYTTNLVTYKYTSHEYAKDGTYNYREGSFTLVFGGPYNTTVNDIGSLDLDITGLSTSDIRNLRVGDKAVLNLTAAAAVGDQQLDIAYDYDDHAGTAADPGACCQRFVFDSLALNGQTAKSMHFYTINANALSEYYGQSYNGYIDITTGVLTNTGIAAYLSYYDPAAMETFMVEQATTDDFWRTVTAGIGVNSQEAQRMVKNQEMVLNELETKRQSISGVSMDEEMTNMIKYQHVYSAGARFITTIDEQIDLVVNRMGLVGRG